MVAKVINPASVNLPNSVVIPPAEPKPVKLLEAVLMGAKVKEPTCLEVAMSERAAATA